MPNDKNTNNEWISGIHLNFLLSTTMLLCWDLGLKASIYFDWFGFWLTFLYWFGFWSSAWTQTPLNTIEIEVGAGFEPATFNLAVLGLNHLQRCFLFFLALLYGKVLAASMFLRRRVLFLCSSETSPWEVLTHWTLRCDIVSFTLNYWVIHEC